MNEIRIILDLAAGILAGIQVLIPPKVYKRIDKYLLGYLSDKPSPTNRRLWISIIMAILVTIGVILAISYSGIITDINNGHIAETVFLILGLLSGMGVLALIIFFRGTFGLKGQNPPTIAIWSGIILGIGSILFIAPLYGHISISVSSFFLAFAVSIMILGTCIGLMPIAQWLLTFQSGVLLRLGITLFIASKIIELVA